MSDIRFQTFDESGNLIEDVLLPNPADNIIEANAAPLLVSGPIAFKYENGDPVQFLTATKDQGKGQPIMQVAQATSTQAGFVSAADWSTFNAKAPSTLTKADGSSVGLAGFSDLYFTANSGIVSPKLADAKNTLLVDNINVDGQVGMATFSSTDFLDNGHGAIFLNYGGGQKASSTKPGFLTAEHWVQFNSKSDFTVAKANNSTAYNSGIVNGNFGISTFYSQDFKDNDLGAIYLNYDSAQKANASQPGFLTASDWSTFNNKQPAITLSTVGNSGAATLINNVLNIPNYTLGGDNLYNSDGLLEDNRIVTLNGHGITFQSGNSRSFNINFDGSIAFNGFTGGGAPDITADTILSNGITANSIAANDQIVTPYFETTNYVSSVIITPGKIDIASSSVLDNLPQTLGSIYVNNANNHLYYKSPSGTNYDLVTAASGGVTNITTTGPITGGPITTTGTIGIQKSTAVQDGYLSSTDWSTFNSKQSTISLTTTGFTGTASLVGSTLNIPNYSAVDGANASRWVTSIGISGLPATGEVRFFNGGILSTATSITFHATNSSGVNYNDWFANLQTLLTAGSPVNLKITKTSNTSVEVIYDVTAISYYNATYSLTVTALVGTGSVSIGDVLSCSWIINGKQGNTGPAGASGTNGASGAAGANGATIKLDNTGLSTPTINTFSVNNNDFNATALIYIDTQGLFSNWLTEIDSNLTAVRPGKLTITKVGDFSKFGVYTIDSYNAGGTFTELGLTYVSGYTGSFEVGKDYYVSYSFDGADGTNGTNGVDGVSGANCVEFEFDGTSAGAPANGKFRSSSTSLSSVTTLQIDNENINNIDVTPWLGIIDTNLIAGRNGYIQISEKGNSAITALYSIFFYNSQPQYKEMSVAYVWGSGTLTVGNKYLISYIFDGADGTPGGGGVTNNTAIAYAIALG